MRICKEYHRFQLRVMRMPSSLAERVVVDFSSTKSHPLKYIVSDETSSLVEMILDSYPISNATIDDTIVMSFLIDEVPVSNGGSTGRTLRCVKYATKYLRAHGNCCLHRDYTLLKLKNDHRRIIPAYSEEEISRIAQAADTDSTIGKRDLAIILVESRVEHLKHRSLSKPERIKAVIDKKVGKITKKEIMELCPDISKVTVERLRK